MGGVKRSKKIRSSLNRKSVSKRWGSYKKLDEQITSNPPQFLSGNINIDNPSQIAYDNVRPGTSNEVGLTLNVIISKPCFSDYYCTKVRITP